MFSKFIKFFGWGMALFLAACAIPLIVGVSLTLSSGASPQAALDGNRPVQIDTAAGLMKVAVVGHNGVLKPRCAEWLVCPDGHLRVIPEVYRERFEGLKDFQTVENLPAGWKLWPRAYPFGGATAAARQALESWAFCIDNGHGAVSYFQSTRILVRMTGPGVLD